MMQSPATSSFYRIGFTIMIGVLMVSQGMLFFHMSQQEDQLLAQQQQLEEQLNASQQALSEQLEEYRNQSEAARETLDEESERRDTRLEGVIENKTENLRVTIEALTSNINTKIEQLQQTDSEIQGELDTIDVESNDFTNIVDDIKEAVVSIRTDDAQGSGFFFDEDGYIMTNRHVIEGASAIVAITYEGKTYEAQPLAVAQNADLAVLKVTSQDTFTALEFEDDVRVGQRVIDLGNPFGLSFTVTEGIISALNRQIDESGIGYIQTDVSINQGSSGGPLVNTEKEVIGVNTLKISSGEGLGFAVPADIAQSVAQQSLAINISG